MGTISAVNAASPIENDRVANNAGGTMGSMPRRAERTCRTPNNPSPAIPTTITMNPQAGQSFSGPSVIGSMIAASDPPRSSAAPAVMGVLIAERDSGMKAIAAAIASTASGTLIRKTGRHNKPNQSPSVITAPRMGPVTAARPITDVNIPIAFPRSAGGYST